MDSIIQLPKIFDRDIEEKLSDQEHNSYVSKLAACRQFVELHFRKNYGITAYPICDILLSIQVSGLRKATIASISTDLAMPPHILRRYLVIAEDHGLVEMNNNASIPEVSMTGKGAQDLLLITNAISEVAFNLRPLDPARR